MTDSQTPNATTETATIAIIGAGLSGAAAAWRLAAAGHEVIVLERDVPASPLGSSHGSARIFRYAYPDPFYAGLVVESRRGWDELEAASGTQLITPSGAIDFGTIRNPGQLAGVLDLVGVEHELLSEDAARERWPQLNFNTEVLWHPGAGVIDAETSVKTMLRLAQAAGAELRTAWEVTGVRPGNTGYVITSTSGATVHAEQVIVAAGGWLPELLQGLSLPASFLARLPEFQVRQENAFHFPYRLPGDQGAPAAGERASWPTFVYKGEDMQSYSLPGGRDAGYEGQKIAEYNGGKVIPSARQQQHDVIDPANRARVVGFIEEYVPGLLPTPYAEATCLFTNVPNDDMIIDRIDGITIMSPCSGQGAKFAPYLGELALDLVAGSEAPRDRFRATAQRFASV